MKSNKTTLINTRLVAKISLIFLSIFSLDLACSPAQDSNLNQKSELQEFLDIDLSGTSEIDKRTLYVSMLISLYDLKYFFEFPPTSKVNEAIRKFQSDINERQTGKLTKSQINILNKRWKEIFQKKILVSSIGDKIPFYIDSSFFKANGTISNVESPDEFKINKASIECDKEANVCILDEAYLLGGTQLILDKTKYNLVTWDQSEIIAKNDTSLCGTNEIRINISTETVLFILDQKNIPGCSELTNSSLIKQKYPQISKLVPGFDESYSYWKNNDEKNSKYNSESFSDLIKRFLNVK